MGRSFIKVASSSHLLAGGFYGKAACFYWEAGDISWLFLLRFNY